MSIRVGETQIHISVFIILVPPVLWFAGCLKEYAAAFFSIVLHELGHIIVARIYGCKPGLIRIMPVGLSVSINEKGCSKSASLLIYSAGPVVNLLILSMAALFASFLKADGFFITVVLVNTYLAAFNLIPAFPMDGGRILLELLAGRMGLLAAGRIARRLALVLAAAILIFGLLQLTQSVTNFSLILIGVYIAALWKNSKMESAFMNIKQILYRRSRFLKKGIYQARDLVVVKSTRLDETLKNMDFDRFHLIYVLDDELRLLRVFTETEILNAACEGGGITFGQLIDGSEAVKRNIDI